MEPTPIQREMQQMNAYSDELQQNVRSQLQPIPARCYNFVDENGQREARFVVLLDSQGRAIEAELYCNGQLPDVTQNKVQRMAKKLLATSYAGSGPNIPLTVFDLGRQLGRGDVANPYATEQSEGSFNAVYVIAAIVALFFIVGILFAMLNVVFRNRQEAVAPTSTPPATLAVMDVPAAGTGTESDGAAVDPAALVVETNDLPASRYANPAIGVNMTVQIRAGLRSFVRSEPGSDAGEALSFLQNGETAVIIGGPVMLQGDSDTIVWWYVRLNDGTLGWTPANTSTLALLDPVP